ncbi:MAG: threonine ammonia-lyase IlvA [Bacteroidia bacterium]|nr:threonine ammonia-lyase IlvA [Bacteroidia bacterium]
MQDTRTDKIVEVSLDNVVQASRKLQDVAFRSPLMRADLLSEQLGADIFWKREDLQQVRSYKIRGAYNKITSLSESELQNGVVCASAGNHAQGVAYSCSQKGVKGVIFMPHPTPNQKIEQVRMFGGDYVEIRLEGDSFDDASLAARTYCEANHMTFVHPFDDMKVIEGQATIGLEILDQVKEGLDYLFLPVGGGGLAAGVSSMVKKLSPETTIIGVEPEGAPSMSEALRLGYNLQLHSIDKFVDGAAVRQVGELNFAICKQFLDRMVRVPEGKICQTILQLYNRNAIVVEPAGALTTAALDYFADEIRGKKVVALISGSNNDIGRTEEIRERALIHTGKKHYFVVRFPQRAGALRDFLTHVLGPQDDITFFEYKKKHNRNEGPAVVGLELARPEDLPLLVRRMKELNFFGEYLNDKPDFFQYIL